MLLSALVLPMNHTKKVTAKTIAQSWRSFPNLLTGRETLNSLDFSPLFFRVENTLLHYMGGRNGGQGASMTTVFIGPVWGLILAASLHLKCH